MKRHLTFITIVAVALLSSCNGNDANTSAVQETTKPNVKIAKVTAEEVAQTERYATTVEAEVKNNIIPNSPLRIKKIFVEVGDNVKKGQKLVELDASSLEQLSLQVENQRSEFNRIAELYKIGGVSKSDYEAVKTSLDVNEKALKNRLENTELISPIDGVVSARNYDNGDMYGGQAILVVEQITPVKMKINISEKYYSKVKKGDNVNLQFETYGDEVFTGKINIIYPIINASTHTFTAEITLANNDRRVRPGMYGHATVNFGNQNNVVVPDAAVMKQAGSGDYYVFTYSNGIVKNNKVSLGRRIGDKYEILSGINEGDNVVIAGQVNLADGKEVEVIK
ncbi:MAG: efflux RND transporter periplasmic adaptor subunit [Bacteroidaceae bacterium]|nr:efflux RND transporter periplasmic adaptor subunit [Bacteroidaceae bacterium]